MDLIETATSRCRTMLKQVFTRLKTRVEDLGASLSLRNDRGECAGAFKPCSELCRTLYGTGPTCAVSQEALAQKALADGKPCRTFTQTGCCLVALPVRKRRRVIGSAVVCFPVRQMLDEEHLARMCDSLELDRETVTKLARTACTRTAASSEQMQGFLQHLVECEVAVQTGEEELAALSVNLATTYEELSLVYRISGSMQLTKEPQGYLQNVCDELREVMGVQVAVAIVYSHATTEDRDMVILSGDCGLNAGRIELLASTCLEPNFGEDGRGIVDNAFSPESRKWPTGLVESVVAIPMVTDGPPVGMLIGINKIGDEFDSVDLKLLRSIGNQSAVFLANSRLYADLQDLLMGVLHALTATIDAKDPYTCGHSRRVALISKKLAEDCGFDEQRAHKIYMAGLLHDIGKIGVPEATLCKEGRLTDEEYDQLKSHPMLGAKILGGIRQLDDVIAGILMHHERPDGKGYPRGLEGDQIAIDGRLVGLADSFDAMTSGRTYRKALSLDEVRRELAGNSGAQFDPMLVEKILSWDLEALLEELYQPAETVLPFETH